MRIRITKTISFLALAAPLVWWSSLTTKLLAQEKINLTWELPTNRADIAGVRLYYGAAPNPAVTNSFLSIGLDKGATNLIINQLPIGVTYFQVATYLTNNYPSRPSNSVGYTNEGFAGPFNLRVTIIPTP